MRLWAVWAANTFEGFLARAAGGPLGLRLLDANECARMGGGPLEERRPIQ